MRCLDCSTSHFDCVGALRFVPAIAIESAVARTASRIGQGARADCARHSRPTWRHVDANDVATWKWLCEMARSRKKSASHVQQSLSAARQAIQSLDETVWAVNPGNDTLPHLVQLYRRIRRRIFGQRGNPLSRGFAGTDAGATGFRRSAAQFISRSQGGAQQRRPPRKRERSPVACDTSITARCGLPSRTTDAGLSRTNIRKFCAEGLRNMRQRMEEIGGEFQIESAGSGTKISFTCPWRDEHD